MCFECSKEPSHGDGSFEYPQQMFWLQNKNNFQLRSHIWGPGKVLKILEHLLYCKIYLSGILGMSFLWLPDPAKR